ncbi:pentatricopeptide repeat-containing protein At4g33990-like [Mercurialis annua]|uniref:pentatricopeptide repeat-containing protein At4g33990-like n=1 Tax=Mercurialis annua TaxID=3986 RepID=UPI00215E2EC2|nr:pentatricopeptide repeat-containing protein At4g33990-like [Mercurialis annua]
MQRHFIPISLKLLLNRCSLYSFNHSCTFSYIPDSAEIVYDGLVKICDSLKFVKQIHSSLTITGLVTKSSHLAAQIIIKYGKFGDLNSSRLLFDDININGDIKPSSFLWNTIIRACANAGLCFETLELYMLLRGAGISSNNYTFPFVFKACASGALLLQGKVAHGEAVKIGFDSDLYVEAALVDMYAKCGSFWDGRKIFDEMPVKDLVCWTAMITAYEQAEKPEEALLLFQTMQQVGLLADEITIVSVASAIGQLGDSRKAQSVHAYAVRHWFLQQICVANSILAMFTKCGNMDKAGLVFDTMDERNVISWNSMLSGYTQNGQATEALLLFDEMRDSGCEPNAVTALIMVSVCAYLGSRHLGKKFHDFIIAHKMKVDANLQNALMDMYAKCGDLDTAIKLFNDILPSERNACPWNILISGYGMHGHGEEALRLFSRMQDEGVEPNHITFTSVLSACSHAGLIDEGRKCFTEMTKLSVTLELKHYACMVDMLGRAGLLPEAFDLIKEMPMLPDDSVWGALLLACKIHGNMELGKLAADNLFQLEPDHTGYYVLMSNIYAASNKWQEVGKLRQDIINKGLKKPAAFSMIEYGNEVHGFHTADRENPYWLEVYQKAESLAIEMQIAGHIPDLSCALHDVEEEDKEYMLNYHSEKLALAFGILKLDSKMDIQITKNLRVCNDCHSAFKFISQIYGRKIIVRDTNRFHHFNRGVCSCNDYW